MKPALLTQDEYARAKRALVDEINRAFGDVQRGIGTSLHEADAIDAGEGRAAQLAARRRDSESRWQDIAEADLRQIPFNLNFMNPAGFRYYIPAYLLWYLKDMEDPVQFDPFDPVYMFLQGNGNPVHDFHFSSKFSLLNAEQARAVAHFLEFEVKRAAFYFDAGLEESEEERFDDNEEWLAWREYEIDLLSHGAKSALDIYWGRFQL